MDIIGKIITFVMSTFSNLVGIDYVIEDIKKGCRIIKDRKWNNEV